jgi:putative peptidoglycan lipid II flippase
VTRPESIGRAWWRRVADLRQRFAGYIAAMFAFSAVQQLIGLVRHALIAAYFGLSREFDGYLVVYAVVAMFVFNLSMIYDTVVVARLVQIHQRDGDAALWRTSNRLLLQAIVSGALAAAAILVVLWLALPIVAAGFTAAERDLVWDLAKYFLPWIAIIVPYYAASAHLKALWRFQWVFSTEIAVMLISIGVLIAHHRDVSSLPIAYGCGYAGGLLLLLVKRGMRRSHDASPADDLLRSMSQAYAAIQIGNVTGLADRFYQSYLLPSGISALGYASLIVNSLSSLLTLRDIYVVPLAPDAGREARLERIIQGIAFLSIPCAGFLVVHAERIVELLLQRGQFTIEATALTGAILRIQALSLVLSTVITPLERMFQILDRLTLTQIRYAVGFVGIVTFSYLFVFRLGMDVRGIAWAWVCNSALVLVAVLMMLKRCDVVLHWRGIASSAALATAITIAAGVASLAATTLATGLAAFVIGTIVYGAVILAGYIVIRGWLLRILG